MFENMTALKLYRYYRKQGYRPFIAYMSMLYWKTTKADKYRRIQRIADWINRPYRTVRYICSNSLTTFK